MKFLVEKFCRRNAHIFPFYVFRSAHIYVFNFFFEIGRVASSCKTLPTDLEILSKLNPFFADLNVSSTTNYLLDRMSMPLLINSDSLVHLYDYPQPAILDADDDGDNADERKNTSGRWQRFL